jgi:hypothetical protein
MTESTGIVFGGSPKSFAYCINPRKNLFLHLMEWVGNTAHSHATWAKREQAISY